MRFGAERRMGINGSDSYSQLSQKLLSLSNKKIPGIDFFYEVTRLLLDNFNTDCVEMLVLEDSKYLHSRISSKTKYAFNYDFYPYHDSGTGTNARIDRIFPLYNYLRTALDRGKTENFTGICTGSGIILVNRFDTDVAGLIAKLDTNRFYGTVKAGSMLLIPLTFDNKATGLLNLISETPGGFPSDQLPAWEDIAIFLAIALANHHNQAALTERVKELSCLSLLTQISVQNHRTLDEFLASVVELLPPSWQYPEIASARICFDGQIYYSAMYREGWQRQSSDIIVNKRNRGFVEVVYSQTKPKLDEGPFLAEERDLIDSVAKQLSFIIESKEAERERQKLQEQLRHTDRLALIGQLAAGVAHELNEPLGSILGFAQLVGKTPGLTEDASRDLSKIIKASLYSREVIKKLLVFAREVPAQLTEVSLNTVIVDGMYFFEGRCVKSQIEVVRSLAAGLPKILGDESQLNQVLINLVVNSIHAMPGGGKLMIQTSFTPDYVALTIEDTGTGMSEEVKNRIFMPFFTTKAVHEGTGLGLAVVHGIVSSHNGEIRVESWQGKGTRFEIRFPLIKNDEENK